MPLYPAKIQKTIFKGSAIYKVICMLFVAAFHASIHSYSSSVLLLSGEEMEETDMACIDIDQHTHWCGNVVHGQVLQVCLSLMMMMMVIFNYEYDKPNYTQKIKQKLVALLQQDCCSMLMDFIYHH